jgi:hypothetical protein
VRMRQKKELSTPEKNLEDLIDTLQKGKKNK